MSGDGSYRTRFVDPATAEKWFAELRHGIEWRSERRMYATARSTSRRLMSSFRLDPASPSTPDAILDASRLVDRGDGECAFDSVGLNLYRDGRDSVAPHNDHPQRDSQRLS